MKRLVRMCVSLVAAAALALPMVACESTGGYGQRSGPVQLKYKCSKCGLPGAAMSNEPAPVCCGGRMTVQR